MEVLGLLPCQLHAYTQTLRTTVISCEDAGKGVGKWVVVLASTPMYPEGGGQPADFGWLQACEGAECGHPSQARICDVQRRPDGSVAHTVSMPFPPETLVEVAVDFARRYDHMQQHTGQHLVSAIADEVLGADTASWELHSRSQDGDAAGTADEAISVELEAASVTAAQILAVEERCNEVIRAAKAVQAVAVPPGADHPLLHSPLLRGKLPPPGKVPGAMRLVEIAGVDVNACGGTHLASTAELQLLRVVGADRARGRVRLRVLLGGRALAALGRALPREAAHSKALGCAPGAHADAVARLQAERREGAKVRKALTAEVAAAHGAALAVRAAANSGVAAYHREDDSLPFLSSVPAAALAADASVLLLLTAAATQPASKATAVEPLAGCFLLAGPPGRVAELGPRVAAALGGQGGGRPGLFQGKASRLDHGADAFSLLQS